MSQCWGIGVFADLRRKDASLYHPRCRLCVIGEPQIFEALASEVFGGESVFQEVGITFPVSLYTLIRIDVRAGWASV